MKIRKFLLIFIGALLGLCFLVSFSYAYYTGNSSLANATNVTNSVSFFSNRSSSYVLTVMTTQNNFNIINEEVGSFTGYQILQVIPRS